MIKNITTDRKNEQDVYLLTIAEEIHSWKYKEVIDSWNRYPVIIVEDTLP